MKRDPRSSSRMRRLTGRQRKKLRVGQFQEHCFDVELVFGTPLSDEARSVFVIDFLGFLEERAMLGGGFGGRAPVSKADGVVAMIGRGSPTEQDREAVVGWLRTRPEVAEARALDFRDAWHGYNF